MSLDLTTAEALPDTGFVDLDDANKWYVVTWDDRVDYLTLKCDDDFVLSWDPTIEDEDAATVADHFPPDGAVQNEYRVSGNRVAGVVGRTQVAVASATAGARVHVLIETDKEGR